MTKLNNIPTFIITMPEETKRQKKAIKQLKGLCSNYEFFVASKTPTKFPSEYIAWKRRLYFGRDLTFGEFGCFDSHKSVLKKIVSEKIEKALILEDDFIFLKGFEKNINNLLNCSYKWELVRLLDKPKLKYRMKKTIRKFDNEFNLVRLSTSPGGAYAYIISLEGAKKLLAAMNKIWCPIDLVMGQPWRTNIEILAILPAVATWDQSFISAIGDKRFKKRQLQGWHKFILPFSRFYFKIFEGTYRKFYFFRNFFKVS